MGIASHLGKVFGQFGRPWTALGYVVRGSANSDITADPTITSGAGVPDGDEPDGSLYLRTTGAHYQRSGGAWAEVPGGAVALDDPGDTESIPVGRSAAFGLVIADASENNTCADPEFEGQRLALYVRSRAGSGTRVVLFDSPINTTGNDEATFDAARQVLELLGVRVGADLRWQVINNVGTVALSTD